MLLKIQTIAFVLPHIIQITYSGRFKKSYSGHFKNLTVATLRNLTVATLRNLTVDAKSECRINI